MGKYITESNENLNVAVGETVFLQNDNYSVLKKGDRVYAAGNSIVNSNEFSDDLLEYYKNYYDAPSTTNGAPTAMTGETRDYWDTRPMFKTQSYQHEITMGGYTYAPCWNSGQAGQEQLQYVRIDPTTKNVSLLQINYVGAGSFQNIGQTYAPMILTGNGSKLFAYFIANSVWQCYTSTNGIDWTDETSSFNLSASIDRSSSYVLNYTNTDDVNAFSGTLKDNSKRYLNITWCGNAFLMHSNDSTDSKFYTSTDGLTWTDVSTTFFPATVLIAASVWFTASINPSSGKCMVMGLESTNYNYFGAYSTDGGTTWSSSTINITSVNVFWNVCYKNPLDENKLIASREGYENTFAITVDGGATWNELTLPFSTASKGSNSGLVYFGNYIYVKKNIAGDGAEAPIMVSDDNGSTWSQKFEINFNESYRIFNDDYRIYIAAGSHLYYSTDGSTFIYRQFSDRFTNNQWRGAVSIDANKTVFLSNNNVAWIISSDGCATFDYIYKLERNGYYDWGLAGLNMKEVGYLSNAKMIANLRDNSTNTVETNSYWTDWIFDPQYVQLHQAGTPTGEETKIYIRTK